MAILDHDEASADVGARETMLHAEQGSAIGQCSESFLVGVADIWPRARAELARREALEA